MHFAKSWCFHAFCWHGDQKSSHSCAHSKTSAATTDAIRRTQTICAISRYFSNVLAQRFSFTSDVCRELFTFRHISTRRRRCCCIHHEYLSRRRWQLFPNSRHFNRRVSKTKDWIIASGTSRVIMSLIRQLEIRRCHHHISVWVGVCFWRPF